MSSPITTTVQVQTFPTSPLVPSSTQGTNVTNSATTQQLVRERFACVSTALAELQPTRGNKREQPLLSKIERLITKVTELVDAFTRLARSPSFRTGRSLEMTQIQPKVAATELPVTEATVEPSDFTPAIPDAPAPSVLEEPTIPTLIPTPEVATEAINTDRGPIDLGSVLRASGQFLWKPVSEKDGRLAILLPSSLTGKVKEVVVLKPDGSRALQRGQYAGVGNENREHFRFSKAGGEFPDGSIVLVKLNDGSSRHLKISETSARYTR